MPFAHKRFQRWISATKTPQATNWRRLLLISTVLLIGAWGGVTGLHLRYGTVVDALAGVLIASVLFTFCLVLLGLIRSFAKHTYPFLGLTGVAAIFTISFLAISTALPPALALPLALIFIMLIVTIASGLYLLSKHPTKALAILLVPLVTLSSFVYWVFSEPAINDPVVSLITPAQHTGEQYQDLLKPGPFHVAQLSYGSGNDQWREAFAQHVSWISQSVDARRLLHSPSGWGITLRQWWWGFGLDALPLNGRVWYPEHAEGLLPMVLIAHGNHNMMQWSDTGYDWLGEHLASHGYIVISVDQNFLNSGILGGLANENATRAWMLLEHLRAWRDWQQNPSHSLHSQADLNRIVLFGHSRAGEAVALAAVFNTLSYYPEDGLQRFDYGFGIRGIASIAGFTGTSGPSDKPITTRGVNYFAIHGGYDTDVFAFAAERQYLQSQFLRDKPSFRASLYIHHANHGQYNTGWRDDTVGPMLQLINRKALLSGEEQRQIALLYLTAFAQSSFSDNNVMPPLFCDAEKAGSLLPRTLYVNRCEDQQRILLAGFNDDLDLQTTAVQGLQLVGQDLSLWKEKDIGLRAGHKRLQTGLWIGWPANAKKPALILQFTQPQRFSSDSVLWLDLAQADQQAPDTSNQSAKAASALRTPLAINIVLEDIHGNRFSSPLTTFKKLLPPLPVQPYRLSILNKLRFQNATEPLLQSIAVPLHLFAQNGIDLSALRSISLEAEPNSNGVLIIGRITLTEHNSQLMTRSR